MAQSAFSFDFAADDVEKVASHPCADDREDESFVAIRASLEHGDPHFHSLETLLSSLPSSLQFSFKEVPLHPKLAAKLPQRAFHDMAAQLMAEDDMLGDANHGLMGEDVKPNVYEGGLKTWECAEDLAIYLAGMPLPFLRQPLEATVIELGAGSALPILTILQRALLQKEEHILTASTRLHLILADYNLRVLEVATIPNIFLTWAMNPESEGCNELEISPSLKTDFLKSLTSRGITISALSGGWSTRFQEVLMSRVDLTKKTTVLILASETIYSPDSLQAFAEVVISVLQAAKRKGLPASALVAAKRVYFGVGGGIDDFLAALEGLGGYGQLVWQSDEEGVGRAIIEIRIAEA